MPDATRTSDRVFRRLNGEARFTLYDGPEHADFHALRHSYLIMLGKTADLRTVQELNGPATSCLTA